METRRKKAQRILAVREQLLRAEQWRLADIVRERTRLQAARHDLVGTLNTSPLAPVMIEQACRHLDRLATADAQAQVTHQAQEARVREEGLATKRAERFAETAARAARSEEERAALREIAEASAPKPDASLA